MQGQSKNDSIRFAVGAGNAYLLDRNELRAQLEEIFVGPRLLNDNRRIKALIVPGLGYDHVIDTLSETYRYLVDQKYDEIFLISDPILHKSDRLSFEDSDMWETPLGRLETSHRIVQIASSDDHAKDLINIDNSMHQGELSIELQLPFIQTLFGSDIRLLPMMVGDISPRIVGGTLERSIDQDDLIICVTQLSSGYPESYSVEMDKHLRKIIAQLDLDSAEKDNFDVTSPNSVRLLMQIASLKKWKISELEYKRIKLSGGREEGITSFILYE